MKQDIIKAQLQISEFGSQDRAIKLYSILAYSMYKEDKRGTKPVDILARPLLLDSIIDKEWENCINNLKNNTTELHMLLKQFYFKNIKVENLFALLFWFRLDLTLRDHDKDQYLYIHDKQENVYLFGNASMDIHYNIMNANLFFTKDVLECLELRNL